MNELLNNYRYLSINKSFIYFPSFLIGEWHFCAVAFGINIAANIPVAVLVQKNVSKKNYLYRKCYFKEIR